MAQLEKTRRCSESPQTPTTSPTFEHYLRAEDAYWSTTLSPSKSKHIHLGQQENANSPTNNKKSVLAKVKERAKTLKRSLSGKKRHGMNDTTDMNPSPTSVGANLDDDDDDNEQYVDPEYFGAPMYESEVAPEICKEMARQHPRAVPVVSEKHVLPDSADSMKNNTIQGNDKSISPNATQENDDKPNASNKTVSETVTEKLAPAPAYAAVSDTTHTIASKIANLTVTTPGTQGTAINADENLRQFNASSSQKWDKGISVKEYFMDAHALEPGEDDKTLSEAITDAISPKSSTVGGSGVVEKVKEAVTSFFWNEESSNSSKIAENASFAAAPTFSKANSDKLLLKSNAHSSEVLKSASAKFQPVSSKYHEVSEKENHGKILQAN